MAKTIHHDLMRKENMMMIYQCIQENGPILRKDLKEKTGLSWGTVSSAVNDLLEKNLVYEKPVDLDKPDKGRTPSEIDIATSQLSFLGIDINRAGLTVILMDMKCRIQKSYFEEIEETECHSVLRQICKMTDIAFQKAKEDQHEIGGIGISMQGNVDGQKGVSIFTPYFENWNNVPLKQIFTDRYNCSVVVGHNPECATLYEIWCGVAKGVSNMLYVRIGHSLGISIVIDGKTYNGYNGNAGEFGHMIVKPDGEKCRCGRHGCLETVASMNSLLKHISEDDRLRGDQILTPLIENSKDHTLSMEQVYQAYCRGDEICRDHIRQLVHYLAIGISNLINLFNPELLVLGGDMVRYSSVFIDQLRNEVNETAWNGSSKVIITSINAYNTAAMGAAIDIFQQYVFATV